MDLLNSRIAGEHISEHLWVIQDVLHHGVVHHLTHRLLHLLWVTHSSQTLSAQQHCHLLLSTHEAGT